MSGGSSVNIEKATAVVIKYLEQVYGNLGLLSFILDDIKPNSKKDVLIVNCNFFPSMGSDERIYYTVHVNIENGQIISAEKRKKEDDQ
ncbi:MAG: hypothetical protein U9O53_01710 [archaeon]|nr:hypothetical protein [archaeon]